MKTPCRITPEQKLMLIAISALFAVATDNACLMAGYLAALILLFRPWRIEKRKLRLWLAALLLTGWGTIFSQSLFYSKEPRTALWTLLSPEFPFLGALTGGIYVFREGIDHGMVQALRLCISLTCGLLVCFTTEAKDMLRAAVRLKIPYAVSFMVSVGLRFIPLIVEETRTVLSAQRMRGFRPLRSGLWHPLRTANTVLTPILTNCIRRSAMLSLSVESRHFGARQAAYAPASSQTSTAMAACGLGIIASALLAIAGMKFFTFLYIANYYYTPALRTVYGWVDRYL